MKYFHFILSTGVLQSSEHPNDLDLLNALTLALSSYREKVSKKDLEKIS